MENINRRGFIRSIFSLGSLLPQSVQDAEASKGHEQKGAGKSVDFSYFWSDLKTGQVGFPSGLIVPRTQPGSVMKIVTAACLIDDLHHNQNETHECTGTAVIGRHKIHCQHAHGKIALVDALGMSCNIYFALASQKLSMHMLLDKARAFGLDRACAGTPAGSFPQTRDGAPSLTYALGLAPDLEPNLLQLMRLAALVGLAPGAALPILHSAENLDLIPKEQALKSPLTERSHGLIVEGMRLAARKGTARKLDPEDQLHVAVKTGTVPHGARFQSCAVGFFPIDKPRHAFAIFAPAGTSQDAAIPRLHQFLFSTTWPS
ncbi:MAG: hypothetical protein J0H83_14280 [Candidatus Melainabacteria bacterium]|nr:hypothetical protein [Candidatus Melainabacteria bacterium]